MKRDTRIILNKAIDCLILSVEHFNRPYEKGRSDTVLILLDHSYEMLLKAAILHKGGKIFHKSRLQTIGFDHCVKLALNDGKIRFLNDQQALIIRQINSLRDAAQHYYLIISEQQLYFQTQAGFTLFGDILQNVFAKNLSDSLPPRVLPISTVAPTDIISLFENELEEITKLLKPGIRKRTEAFARLLPLTIFESTINGSDLQPTSTEINKKIQQLKAGENWERIFSGVTMLDTTITGNPLNISLRITKKEGIPIHQAAPDAEGVNFGVRTVNELDKYSLSHNDLAKHVGLSTAKLTAVIWALRIQSDVDCHKEFVIGKSRHKRYSQKAIKVIKESLKAKSPDEIWDEYKNNRKNSTEKVS